jgi:tetratricopeptide (TPR) repeat protein
MSTSYQAQPVLSVREADRLRDLARRVSPTHAGAQSNCGVLLARRGLTHEAAACFERALDIDPRMALAAQNLTQLAARTNVAEERIGLLSARLKSNADDAPTSLALGKWYARLGRHADAQTVLHSLVASAGH